MKKKKLKVGHGFMEMVGGTNIITVLIFGNKQQMWNRY